MNKVKKADVRFALHEADGSSSSSRAEDLALSARRSLRDQGVADTSMAWEHEASAPFTAGLMLKKLTGTMEAEDELALHGDSTSLVAGATVTVDDNDDGAHNAAPAPAVVVDEAAKERMRLSKERALRLRRERAEAAARAQQEAAEQEEVLREAARGDDVDAVAGGLAAAAQAGGEEEEEEEEACLPDNDEELIAAEMMATGATDGGAPNAQDNPASNAALEDGPPTPSRRGEASDSGAPNAQDNPASNAALEDGPPTPSRRGEESAPDLGPALPDAQAQRSLAHSQPPLAVQVDQTVAKEDDQDRDASPPSSQAPNPSALVQ